MEKAILKKLRGYKAQDDKFNIYSDYYFIKPEQVLQKLTECDYTCYYCKQRVKTEYTCRDKGQWTLDRIDNTMGHNTSNVLISCLQCNLKRRNRPVHKFLFTKQLVIQKSTTPSSPAAEHRPP
jgi:hypothetical protein